jgi:hypothetical protein
MQEETSQLTKDIYLAAACRGGGVICLWGIQGWLSELGHDPVTARNLYYIRGNIHSIIIAYCANLLLLVVS